MFDWLGITTPLNGVLFFAMILAFILAFVVLVRIGRRSGPREGSALWLRAWSRIAFLLAIGLALMALWLGTSESPNWAALGGIIPSFVLIVGVGVVARRWSRRLTGESAAR